MDDNERFKLIEDLKAFSRTVSDLEIHLNALNSYELIISGKKEAPEIFGSIEQICAKIHKISHTEFIEKEYLLSQLLKTAELESYSEYSIYVAVKTFLKKKAHIDILYEQLKNLMEEHRQLDGHLQHAELLPLSHGLKERIARFRNEAKAAAELSRNAEFSFRVLISSFESCASRNSKLLHNLNRRYSFVLEFINSGRKVKVPARVIINAAYIDKLFEMPFPGMARFTAINNFLRILSKENVDELEKKVLNVVTDALQEALPRVNEQYDLFIAARQITVVIDLLKESVGEVMLVMAHENGAAHVTYEKGSGDLRIHLDILYLSGVLNGQQSFQFLVSTIIHELNHIFDKYALDTNDRLNGIRKEGLAVFAELAAAPKEEIERSWKISLDIAAEPLPGSNKEYQERVKGNKMYYIGLYLWMSIFLYFAKRKLSWINVAGCFSNPGIMADTLLNPDVKRLMNLYLRTFRNVNLDRFIKLQEVAAKSMGVKTLGAKPQGL
jgi:hypothetical protein